VSEVAWMALAWRSGAPAEERWRVASGAGPREEDFPEAAIARCRAELVELAARGVRIVRAADAEFPDEWRLPRGPLALQVAGRPALLREPEAAWFSGVRGAEGARLADRLDRGGLACVLLAKGLLRAQAELSAFAEPLSDGSLALVSAEPPRAAWGPVREARRKALLAARR
jgi:hypothetical protein